LADTISRCLEKDPDRRFADTAQLRAALAAAAPGASRVVPVQRAVEPREAEPTTEPDELQPLAASALALAGDRPVVDTGIPALVISDEPPPPRRRSGLWFGLVAAAVALVIGAAVLIPQITGGHRLPAGANGPTASTTPSGSPV